jgi:hypothetical protein
MLRWLCLYASIYGTFFLSFQGVLLLHMPSVDYRTIIFRLVEEFSFHDELSPETKSELLRTLLLPRRFVAGQSLTAVRKIGSELHIRSHLVRTHFDRNIIYSLLSKINRITSGPHYSRIFFAYSQ